MVLAAFLEVPCSAIPRAMEISNMSKRNQLWAVSNTAEPVAVNNCRLNLTWLGASACLPSALKKKVEPPKCWLWSSELQPRGLMVILVPQPSSESRAALET